MVITVLFVSGLMGAVVSGLGLAVVSGLVGSSFPLSGQVSLMAMFLGFVAGFSAPLMWSIMGVGFANRDCTNGCSEGEYWCHAVFIAVAFGTFQGIIVFAVANLAKPPVSLIPSVPYIFAFIIVAEIVGILGRGFNWLLGRVV